MRPPVAGFLDLSDGSWQRLEFSRLREAWLASGKTGGLIGKVECAGLSAILCIIQHAERF
jgi:hypothetical protein